MGKNRLLRTQAINNSFAGKTSSFVYSTFASFNDLTEKTNFEC